MDRLFRVSGNGSSSINADGIAVNLSVIRWKSASYVEEVVVVSDIEVSVRDIENSSGNLSE